jgi:hypothetical protein
MICPLGISPLRPFRVIDFQSLIIKNFLLSGFPLLPLNVTQHSYPKSKRGNDGWINDHKEEQQ